MYSKQPIVPSLPDFYAYNNKKSAVLLFCTISIEYDTADLIIQADLSRNSIIS